MTDESTRYRHKEIAARQIDVLTGLSKGISADGVINQDEAEFLHKWLVQNRSAHNNPIITDLLHKIEAMLSDDVLDDDEAQELLATLHKFNGDESELGELAQTTSLPLNHPAPQVISSERKFAVTGTCAFGNRNECKLQVESLGGIVLPRIRQDLNYLILGKYVTDSWKHETFGNKIEEAVSLRDEKGLPLAIIGEEHWQQAVDQASPQR